MSEGRLRCSGTSLFLKKRFGAGYVLNIAKANEKCDVSNVTDLIRSHVSEAQVVSAVAGEIVYQLPVTAVSSFGAMFGNLRDKAEGLHVGAYGVSITTLEQVFIRLAREANKAYRPGDEDITPVYLMDMVRYAYSKCCVFYRWLRSKVVSHPEPSRSHKDLVLPTMILTPAGLVAEADDPEEKKGELQDEQLVVGHGSSLRRDSSVREAWSDSDPRRPPAAADVDVQRGANKADVASLHSDFFQELASNNLVNATNQNGQAPSVSPKITSFNRETDPSNKLTTTVASTYVQLKELMRKRLIIALRDLKGFFFQIFFPALQILLVLMLLTININPAGKSLTMHASTIDGGAQVLYSGNITSVAGGHLSSQRMSLIKTHANNSKELSK